MTRVSLARLRRALPAVAVFLGALAVWEAAARAESSFLFPRATTVLQRAWHVWPSEDFLSAVAASLERLVVGFSIGAVLGVLLGLLMGSSRATRRTLEPLVELARATPAIAWVPAAIVILGLGNAMRVSVIAVGVFFPVLVGTLDGVRAVSPETRDTATMLHVGWARRVFGVYLPASLPWIVAGLRVALSIGLVMVVISELVGGGEGLGVYLKFQQSQFNVAELYGGVLFLGVLGFVLNRLFVVAERRVLAWHHGAAGDAAR